MADSLGKRTLSGLVWSFLETFALNAFGFVQGVILARLLMPSDYGLIAMTGVFFSVSYSLIDSGFTNALIRKKERTEVDYSTVYVTNVVLSFVLSVILYSCSSLIANFYHEPLLEKIVGVNALLMFLGSFVAVQGTKLTIQLNFKAKSVINVIATTITGIVSIVMAYMGYGVWSLIYPNFVSLLLRAIIYWYYQRWFPGWRFSWKVYKEYFSYGSRLLLSGLLNTLYGNIYPIVIGRYYSSTSLGLYNKARGYASLPSTTVSGILSKVTFPVLARIQSDDEKLQEIYRRMIRVSAYVVFPIMVLLAVLARPFVIVLITEKWENCIIYLQILCFSMMWYPIHALNLNLLMVKGHSNLFLRLEVIKKIIGIAILFVTIPMGLLAMCYGSVISSVLCLFVNTYYTGKFINVGFFRQMKDILPTMIYSSIMGLIIWLSVSFIPQTLYNLQLIIGIVVGVVSYLVLSKVTKSKDYLSMLDLIEHNIPKRWTQIINFLR